MDQVEMSRPCEGQDVVSWSDLEKAHLSKENTRLAMFKHADAKHVESVAKKIEAAAITMIQILHLIADDDANYMIGKLSGIVAQLRLDNAKTCLN